MRLLPRLEEHGRKRPSFLWLAGIYIVKGREIMALNRQRQTVVSRCTGLRGIIFVGRSLATAGVVALATHNVVVYTDHTQEKQEEQTLYKGQMLNYINKGE